MEAPRLTAVGVLPTPPFWFATARTLPMPGLKLRGGPVGRAWVVCSPPNGLVLPRFTAAMKGGPGWLVGFHTKRRIYRHFVLDPPSFPVVRAAPTQRPLHRHPPPARKTLRRGRHLAKHVEMA